PRRTSTCTAGSACSPLMPHRAEMPVDLTNLAQLRFSSSDFAGLEDVNRFGEPPGAPGTAAELPQDAPGLELGIGTLARRAEPGMHTVTLLVRCRLVPAPVRRADTVLADVAFIAQHHQARGGQ